jgi:ribonucleoside-triphosphate reductase (formate)
VSAIEQIKKRDGRTVVFDAGKITDAIFKAAQAVGGEDRELAEELTGVAIMFLDKNFSSGTPGIEDIQDMVEKVLIETGHAKTAKAYILYRERRSRAREALQVRRSVRKTTKHEDLSTDIALQVEATAQQELVDWDRSRVAKALIVEADLDEDLGSEIAAAVEKRVIESGIKQVSTALIRALVDNELLDRGMENTFRKQAVIGMPKYDLEQLIFSKSSENSNITSNNPEAINLTIAEHALKQYALQEIFSAEVSNAHKAGLIHLHDLGYPTRVYCSSHSLEYIKKYGLQLSNLDTASGPAKHARTLTGHLNTFLASMQAYYAGALGVGYVNILYAPYLENMTDEEMLQEAQYLIFSSSQNAFSRGGQTLFLDFNIHTGIPGYLADLPAIGPGGKYTGKTYGEYKDLALRFTRALLDVWRAGDAHGHIFAFPKCDLHINDETLSDPEQLEILKYACQISSENGTPYFVFDRDEVTLAACCRLRTKIEDNYMLKHIESMRFCGFQNVTVNLPQCAYRAGPGNWDGIKHEIDKAMDIVMKAHLQKKAFIKRLMATPEMPLWQVGKTAADGRPYIDLEACTFIIGLIGLNEALQYLTGRELHDNKESLFDGFQIINYMFFKAKELGKQYGLKVTLEESPAESAARRLAKLDLANWPQAAEYVCGSIENDDIYYTNSIHIRADANIDLLERVRLQAKFHPRIESGAIIHAFVGEERPPADSILSLLRKTFEKTEAAQLTVSPEFTICNSCHASTPGIKEACGGCRSEDIYGVTRVVGYFSRVSNWNRSKLGELRARKRGNYGLGSDQNTTASAPEAATAEVESRTEAKQKL